MGSSHAHARHVEYPLYAGEISSLDAWEYLRRDASAMLIDVRTPPEWAFSGEPDLSPLGKEPLRLSWKLFPSYAINERFADMLKEAGIKDYAPLFFICRTGGRSLDAAVAATSAGFSHCYNVTDGFEGPLNGQHQRGMLAGWKSAGLPWRQS
jgi:rhodanese-related sulfurtransferase